MADSPEEMARHKRAYWLVFYALCFFTVFTVALAKFEIFDFGHPGISHRDIIVGLVVATVKSSLVGLIFMHLNHEKGLIYKFLVFTFCFATGLMGLIFLAWWNPIEPAFDVGGATEGATTAEVGHSHD
jgi:caa(3)-type oxidase subunit IV